MVQSTTRLRRIAAHAIYTPQGLLKNGIVSVDAQGIITDITQCDRIDSLAGVEFYSGILIPGVVNAHCHLELSYLKGAIKSGGGFAHFAHEIGMRRTEHTLLERLRAAELYDARMWHEGVAAVGDICNGDTTFATKSKSKIYYHNFLELFGLSTDSTATLQSSLEQAREMALVAFVTPHSTYSLSHRGFLAAIEQGGPIVSIHFMESEGESELYEQRGELWQWYEKCGMKVDFLEYGSPTNRIVKSVDSDRKMLLVHNTCVDAGHVDALQSHFDTPPVWVLCPCSNSYITGMMPPIELLRAKGVTIALGTDSLASSHELSMVNQMKLIKGVPLCEMLGWATINGARALGIDSWCGSLEVGKRSGVVLLTGVNMQTGELGEEARTLRII